MISYDEAFTADEFHMNRAGLPCAIWQRDGDTRLPKLSAGQFFVPILRMNEDGFQEGYAITEGNAASFHTPGTCPRS